MNNFYAGNTATNAPQVFFEPSAGHTIDIKYSCIQSNGAYYGAGFSIISGDSHNISADPKFIDPANYDVRLQAHSPCIDAGTSNVTYNFDYAAVHRPQHAAFDMGPYESVLFTTSLRQPVENTYNGPEVQVTFSVGCTPNGVDITKVKVYLKDVLYDSTSPSFSYTGGPAVYTVHIIPSSFDPSGDVVAVTIDAKDLLNNPMTSATYSFYVDGTPPAVTPLIPTSGATQVRLETPLRFELYDPESGIVTSSLFVTINNVMAVAGGVGVAPTFSNLSYSATASYLEDTSRGFVVTITPNSVFPDSSTIDVQIKAANRNAVVRQYA